MLSYLLIRNLSEGFGNLWFLKVSPAVEGQHIREPLLERIPVKET